MSKFNPNYPAYHVGKKRVSRREWILRHHGEEIADAADQGPYWFGESGDITSFFPVLTVWSKTDWPRELDLDTVFPLDIEKFTEGWQGKDGLASFLAASKGVQADFDATMAKIGKQHDELRESYFSKKEAAPRAIADLRAMRDECNRVLVGYARRAALSLKRIRPAIAVLYLETLEVVNTDSEVPVASLPKETRKSLWQVDIVFVRRFWSNVLNGGPSHLDNADGLIARLQWPGVSKALVRFQSEALFAMLEERDEVLTEALPVEYRRFACENLLWKLAHGETVAPWSAVDSQKVTEEHEERRGSKKLRKGRIPNEERERIWRRALEVLQEDERREEDEKRYEAKSGARWSEQLKQKLADEFGRSKTTVGTICDEGDRGDFD